jgi:hypothetical protein|tara:strand:+ start:173 stop:868 length:696 start_codon:yes stop_codon:yes gene_type:complete
MGLFNVHTVSNAYRSDYFQYLSEQWATDDNEFTGMWNRDVTGAASIARVNTDMDMPKVSLTVPASASARLRSLYTFRVTPSKFSNTENTTMVRGVFLEFEAKFTSVANMDNANFFMGFNSSTSGTRTTADVVGFGLSSDAIQTVTDSSGTETVNLPAGITLTNRNLYKIAITGDQVEFWINGNQVATHTTNLPDVLPFLMFYNVSEAGGSSTLDVGYCHVFYRGFDDQRSF